MKANFDVERSLKECPPDHDYYKSLGFIFVKRIVINRKHIVRKDSNQIRVHLVKQSNVVKIKHDFSINGWLYDKQPIGVSESKEQKGKFDLEYGFTRDQAADNLDWNSMIVDVVKPGASPADIHTGRFLVNDHAGAAHTPNSKEDIIAGIRERVERKLMPDTDKAIKAWVYQVTNKSHTNQERSKIYKDYRAKKTSTGPLRTYHQDKGTNSVEETALEFDLPYGGDGNFEETNQLGFVTRYGTLDRVLPDAKNVAAEYSFTKPVHIIGFINEPKAAPALYDQRKKMYKVHRQSIDKEAKWIREVVKLTGKEPLSEDEIVKAINKLICVDGRFLYQHQAPNPDNGGKPYEQGLVDAKGDPFPITSKPILKSVA